MMERILCKKIREFFVYQSLAESSFERLRHGGKSSHYRKKLQGQLWGYEELAIGVDIRIIVRIEKTENRAVLEAIGTHAQLGF